MPERQLPLPPWPILDQSLDLAWIGRKSKEAGTDMKNSYGKDSELLCRVNALYSVGISR